MLASTGDSPLLACRLCTPDCWPAPSPVKVIRCQLLRRHCKQLSPDAQAAGLDAEQQHCLRQGGLLW